MSYDKRRITVVVPLEEFEAMDAAVQGLPLAQRRLGFGESLELLRRVLDGEAAPPLEPSFNITSTQRALLDRLARALRQPS